MQRSHEDNLLFLCRFLALSGPLVAALYFCAGESYWLDSPEFSAAAQVLGLPHPPGHPLYVLFTKPFTLLPFGTIPFRVAVASAVAAAIASYLFFELTLLVLTVVQDATPPWVLGLLSLIGTALLSFCNAWFFQAIRQEVYALQIMFVLAGLYPLVRYLCRPDSSDHRLLYGAAFILGLGLSNHHFVMLTITPAAIPVVVIMFHRMGEKAALGKLFAMTGWVAAGLMVYLFLPLRTMAQADVSLGAVHSIQDFIWVVSAKVYQKSLGSGSSYIPADHLDALFSTMGQLGVVTVIVSLAGFYMLFRLRKTRALGAVVTLSAFVTLLLRGFMGVDPFNPDFYGYILVSLAMLVLGACILMAVVFHVMFRRVRFAGVLSAAALAVMALLPYRAAATSFTENDLSDFQATRQIYDMAIMDAPNNAIAIAMNYKLYFVLWSAAIVEGTRPDIDVVNPKFLSYPGYLANVTQRAPIIKSLAWSFFVKGHIQEQALMEMAGERPVLIGPSPWVNEACLNYLLPRTLLYEAQTEPLSLSGIQMGEREQTEEWNHLYETMGDRWKEHETWRFLSWSHYLDAIYYARKGHLEGARKAVAFSRSIGSSTREINGIEDAINSSSGVIDVTPFLLGTGDGANKKTTNSQL